MRFKKFVCEKEILNGMEFEIIPAKDSHILLQRRKELNMTQQQVAQAITPVPASGERRMLLLRQQC